MAPMAWCHCDLPSSMCHLMSDGRGEAAGIFELYLSGSCLRFISICFGVMFCIMKSLLLEPEWNCLPGILPLPNLLPNFVIFLKEHLFLTPYQLSKP